MDQTFRVALNPLSLCTGTLIVRVPTKAEQRELLKARWAEEGLTLDVRLDFIERLLVGIEEGRYLGEPFTTDRSDWKDCIGEANKNELCARFFEERPLTRIDEKKSETPSGSS
jgi:hypothetical protein